MTAGFRGAVDAMEPRKPAQTRRMVANRRSWHDEIDVRPGVMDCESCAGSRASRARGAELTRRVHHQAMTLRHHEIAETRHRILNPLVEPQLRLLGEIVGAGSATRVLDLACGKGELLSLWASWFTTSGIGVDLSPVFSAAARQRAAELGVGTRVKIVEGDAAAYEVPPSAFDVACCIGATWIGGGLAGTVDLLRPAVRPGGLLLVGEPYWTEPPPADAVAAHGFAPDDYVSLEATFDRLDAAGVELVEMVMASPDTWDRYEVSQWLAVTDWLAANPEDPDHDAMVRFRDDNRRTYLRWGRRYLGWGVFVTRPR
jgi:SAM-dependent methyltransferase